MNICNFTRFSLQLQLVCKIQICKKELFEKEPSIYIYILYSFIRENLISHKDYRTILDKLFSRKKDNEFAK